MSSQGRQFRRLTTAASILRNFCGKLGEKIAKCLFHIEDALCFPKRSRQTGPCLTPVYSDKKSKGLINHFINRTAAILKILLYCTHVEFSNYWVTLVANLLEMIMSTKSVHVALIGILFACTAGAQSTNWDGTYSAIFDFRMSSRSVCPSALPINIELSVLGGQATGVIMNNGGGNRHEFCSLYHNGDITGSVDDMGRALLTVSQADAHSKMYSSYRIEGQIDGELRLISRSMRYHPTKTFVFDRTSDLSAANSVEEADEDFIFLAWQEISSDQKVLVQRTLQSSGLYSSSIDGDLGPQTRQAILAYSRDRVGEITSIASAANVLAQLFVVPTPLVSKTEQAASGVEGTIDTIRVAEPANTSSLTVAQLFRWEDAQSAVEANVIATEMQSTIYMYQSIRGTLATASVSENERMLAVIDQQIEELQSNKQALQTALSARFSTPIRPTNANLGVSAFRAADTFPRVPFYVPGTAEIGEVLVIPRVSNEGFLTYKFDFIDPTATYDKIRDTFNVAHDDVDLIITGLAKIDEWTQVAQENGITRRVEKASACVPVGECDEKETGKSSTEILFQIYEDGSTSGRIQLNKGRFNAGYNLSVESSVLLMAYMTYMRDAGSKEFNIGVMSDDEVLDLFN